MTPILISRNRNTSLLQYIERKSMELEKFGKKFLLFSIKNTNKALGTSTRLQAGWCNLSKTLVCRTSMRSTAISVEARCLPRRKTLENLVFATLENNVVQVSIDMQILQKNLSELIWITTDVRLKAHPGKTQYTANEQCEIHFLVFNTEKHSNSHIPFSKNSILTTTDYWKLPEENKQVALCCGECGGPATFWWIKNHHKVKDKDRQRECTSRHGIKFDNGKRWTKQL